MPAINEVTSLEIESNIAVLTLNSPPVNALSANVREGLHVGVKRAIDDEDTKAIVLICEGRTFIAGADITEFGQAPKGPSLFEVQDHIKDSTKPIILSLHRVSIVALSNGFKDKTLLKSLICSLHISEMNEIDY